MEGMISKSAIMRDLEEQIREYEGLLQKEWVSANSIHYFTKLYALKDIYNDIKDMSALFGDCTDKSNDFTAKELELGAEINDLKVRLKFAHCEIEKLTKERNELLKELNEKLKLKKCGKWIDKPYERWKAYDIRFCSSCGWSIHKSKLRKCDLKWNYCPSCGADMIGGSKTDTEEIK